MQGQSYNHRISRCYLYIYKYYMGHFVSIEVLKLKSLIKTMLMMTASCPVGSKTSGSHNTHYRKHVHTLQSKAKREMKRKPKM